MGFYNVQQGDAPYLKYLADNYAMSDNYHQAVMGGTGANHIMMGTGDAIWFSDGNGHAMQRVGSAPDRIEIENPNPQPGTNNYYTQDGYRGGSYVACARIASQLRRPPRALLDYLKALSYAPMPNCEPGRYYLVNNYDPGYLGTATLIDTQDPSPSRRASFRTIGDDAAQGKRIVPLLRRRLEPPICKTPKIAAYCNICNFLQYTPTIMTDAALRIRHIKDITDLYDDIANGNLPAVSFVKPSGLIDGHPASSKFDLFEAFVTQDCERSASQPEVWGSTAIFVTFDEGGGYWDSGYVQPVDFFGDGPRVPMIVVSPYAFGGRILHSYKDHVSILKFIEKNWESAADKPPQPGQSSQPDPAVDNPYVPSTSRLSAT